MQRNKTRKTIVCLALEAKMERANATAAEAKPVQNMKAAAASSKVSTCTTWCNFLRLHILNIAISNGAPIGLQGEQK